MPAHPGSSKDRMRSMFRVQAPAPGQADESVSGPDSQASQAPQPTRRRASPAANPSRRRPEQMLPSGDRVVTDSDAAPVETAATGRAGRYVRRAFTVDERLLQDVTDAVVVLSGWPHQLTLTQFVDEAFRTQLECW